MAFNPEKQFVDGENPFADRPQTNESLVGDSSDRLESVNTPDHSFEAFVEDFQIMVENDPGLRLLNIDPKTLGEIDAKYWFKFRESVQGNLVFSLEDMIDYRSFVSFNANPSREAMAGYLANKSLILWRTSGALREQTQGPNTKTDQ